MYAQTQLTAQLSSIHAEGVWVSILGANVTKDGYVAFSDIIEKGGNLHCNTNKMDCCASTIRTMRYGEWYSPNNNRVKYGSSNNGATFLRNRGQRFVGMYCSQCSTHDDNSPPRGRYHCTVPNASNVSQTYYINIRRLTYISSLNYSGYLYFSHFSGYWCSNHQLIWH